MTNQQAWDDCTLKNGDPVKVDWANTVITSGCNIQPGATQLKFWYKALPFRFVLQDEHGNAEIFDAALVKLAATYRIGKDGELRWIECLICGLRSYNPNDVEHLYCGNCHQFHEKL
jgi:hypothetical protein